MRKIVFVILMALISAPAALLAIAGLAVIEVVVAYRHRSTTMGGIRHTPDERETFELALQEAEHRAIHVGPTIL